MKQFKSKTIRIVMGEWDPVLTWVPADCLSHLAIHHTMFRPTIATVDWSLTHIRSGLRLFNCHADLRKELERAARELDPEFDDYPYERSSLGKEADMDTEWAQRVAPKIYEWWGYFNKQLPDLLRPSRRR